MSTNEIEEQGIYCPYCGESISVLVDCSIEQQSYIEDCQVCCRPINLTISCDENGEATIAALHENE
jgi:Cysteine-rich CPXCG